MQLLKSAQILIRDSVRSSPLDPEEYRRIVKLGALYIALEDAPKHDHMPWLVKLNIDGVIYKLCSRKNAKQETTK